MRLSLRVAGSHGICQTQSPSLRIYVKEFMTGFALWLVTWVPAWQ
jgi:hypothetical protein